MKREDCNAISVDWSTLASAGDYNYIAVNGVPVAGATTGAFINFLVQQGTPLNAFHLTGFSFGVNDYLLNQQSKMMIECVTQFKIMFFFFFFFYKAQVAGIAAENVKSVGGKVARITGTNIST